MYAETSTTKAPRVRRTQFNRSKAVAVRGMGVSAYLIVLKAQLERNIRATAVNGEIHYALTDTIPEELKMAPTGGRAKSKVRSHMIRFLRDNLGDDLKTAKMRTKGRGVRPMLVISSEGLSLLATYVYHKAQGFDFRGCYNALPAELKPHNPELPGGWETVDRVYN